MRPSNRLLRAVAAERIELERQRIRLAEEARDLRAALARIEAGMAELDERRTLLNRVAPQEPGAGEPERGARGAVTRGGEPERGPRAAVTRDGEPAPGAAVLRGPAIREVAVKALVARGEDSLHYREWFALLEADGYEVAGKDPLAVFLTQLSRSPAVRKGPRAGVYELDRSAPNRLKRALATFHEELAALTKTHDLQTIRARRAQLTADIERTEKALEEIARVLAVRHQHPPDLAAATR